MIKDEMFYAHSREGRPPTEWEPVDDHLRLVALGDDTFPGTGGFASIFGAEELGLLAGWWHDIGKYSVEFRDYLFSANDIEAHLETLPGRVDHSTAGAQHADQHLGGSMGRILAYCIAGHHGGLPDAVDKHGGRSGLDDRLKKENTPSINPPKWILDRQSPPIPSLDFGAEAKDRAFRLSVFCRMLFSCLVDADYLATERFMKPERSAGRLHDLPKPAELLPILDEHLEQKQAAAPDTEVNQQRRAVLKECWTKASGETGLYSLTVPTGGGKTLSSMAFALKHAAQHGLRRVIYAIPFTSIIEQNADEFRKALRAAGPDVVLEHHSNLDIEKEALWSRFAAENWDAPVVITTNVQLCESLFASKTSRCRKLHNIARSVIVLDEVQTLPVDLLAPTLAMLEELTRNYGCTVVLCSATQPAVGHRDGFDIGLRNVHEIIDDVPHLFNSMKRVHLEPLGLLSDKALVEQLRKRNQVLCVVNTRGHAATLFEQLTNANGGRELFHLSAQMCPRHRSAILRLVRNKLRRKEPCRVISTQLVEAGVDIDFPMVYRAMAGLDSIAQAAGRCNREGELEDGTVFIFETDTQPRFVRGPSDSTREVAASHSELLDLDAIEAFFSLHYWKRKSEWDKHGVMKCFQLPRSGPHFQFRVAADAYRLIHNEQKPVIIPYGRRGRRLVEELKTLDAPPGREFDRRLQRFIVGLHEQHYSHLLENQAAAIYHERFCVLENSEAYDKRLGLRLDVAGFDPEKLMP